MHLASISKHMHQSGLKTGGVVGSGLKTGGHGS